jgi:hypothetical protein
MSHVDPIPTDSETPEDVAKRYAAMMDKVRHAADEMNARIEKLSGDFDIRIPSAPPYST